MKRKKKSPIKKLQDKAIRLAKEICQLRDGKICQVQAQFPNIQVKHTDIMQSDHCITRANKHFFIEPRNLTCVCSGCNLAKSMKSKSIDRAIDEIVKLREGIEFFNMMVSIDQSKTPNFNWKSIDWLEIKICMLESDLKLLKEIEV